MKNGTQARILATLAITGTALGAAATAATAAQAASGPLGGLSGLGGVKLYPLAHGALDPMDNSVGTSLSGLPVSTAPVAQFFENGAPLNEVPVVDNLLGTPATAN